MTWRCDVCVADREGVWVQRVKVDLYKVEIRDLYGMQDPKIDLFRIQRVVAVNHDKMLTVQDTWSYQVRNVKVDVLLKPDYLSVSSNPTPEFNFWGRATPLCKDGFNHRFG